MAKGNTAIDGLSGNAKAGVSGAVASSSDVHAIAEDVAVLDHDVTRVSSAVSDHVAEIDSDAKTKAALLGQIQIAIGHCTLNFTGTAHRVDLVRKFRQHAVAGGLDDPAVVLPNFRIDELVEMRLEAFVRALLIGTHQTRIAHHICRQDRGKTVGGCRGNHSSGTPALRKPTK